MQLCTYLNFDGQCEAAFKFYQQCLGGDIPMMLTFADSPETCDISAESRSRIMHTRLVGENWVLMGSDTPIGCYKPLQGFHVNISVDTAEQAERMFKALAANGEITMPMQETFWALRFGMLVDQFGVAWMLNCEKSM